MRLRLTAHPEFAHDIASLPTENLQRRAIQILVDVSNGEMAGQPLENRASVGDLSDCRKVYFDDTDDHKPRYRLVYRLLPDEATAVAVEAVAVGLRDALAAYYKAVKRLHR